MKKTVQIFKTVGDETRLRILFLLLKNGELCVCDLEAALDMPQSTVSRHLAILRNTDLVEGRRRGVWMYYRISADNGIREALFDFLQKYCLHLEQAREDHHRLGAFLKTKKADTCVAEPG